MSSTTPVSLTQTLPLQVFVLRTELGPDNHVAVAYCLLENQKTESYFTALKAITEFLPSWSPKGIIADFELAIYNAAKSLFPNAWYQGCYFHLLQLWRRRLNLIPGYKNGELHQVLRPIFGLPFLPNDEIIPAWRRLEQQFMRQQCWPNINTQRSGQLQVEHLDGWPLPGCPLGMLRPNHEQGTPHEQRE